MCGVSDEFEPTDLPFEPTDLPPEPEEEVDGLPVLADVRPIEPVPPPALPAVQAAAAAATGFVAGAATIALVMRRNARRVGRLQAAASRGNGDEGSLLGVRTFLVHVHVLGRPGE